MAQSNRTYSKRRWTRMDVHSKDKSLLRCAYLRCRSYALWKRRPNLYWRGKVLVQPVALLHISRPAAQYHLLLDNDTRFLQSGKKICRRKRRDWAHAEKGKGAWGRVTLGIDSRKEERPPIERLQLRCPRRPKKNRHAEKETTAKEVNVIKQGVTTVKDWCE